MGTTHRVHVTESPGARAHAYTTAAPNAGVISEGWPRLLLHSPSSPSTDELFADPSPPEASRTHAHTARTHAHTSDAFPTTRFLQSHVQRGLMSVTGGSSDADVKSFEQLKKFVGQILERIRAEHDVSNKEAFQQVVICQRNEQNQRDRTLDQVR